MRDGRSEWLQSLGKDFLKRIGLRQGQTVMDFGCSKGNYAVPAAKVVGAKGRVYALDKDVEALRQLVRFISTDGLSNITPIHVSADQQIPLLDCSVDVALLYDVLHGGYLPEASQRERLLRRICHVVKPGGWLSCYPTHLRKYGLTMRQVLGEMAKAGFRFQKEQCSRLIHDDDLVRGCVLRFRKGDSARKTRTA